MNKSTASTAKNTPTGSQSSEAKAKRAATVTSNREQRIKDRGYALPLELTCTVTKKTVKYTSPTYIDKCISKYGSLEKLQKNFISRDGRRQLAEEAEKSKPAKAPKAEKGSGAPADPIPAAQMPATVGA